MSQRLQRLHGNPPFSVTSSTTAWPLSWWRWRWLEEDGEERRETLPPKRSGETLEKTWVSMSGRSLEGMYSLLSMTSHRERVKQLSVRRRYSLLSVASHRERVKQLSVHMMYSLLSVASQRKG